MMKILFHVIFLIFMGISGWTQKTSFSETALNETFTSTEDLPDSFRNILHVHKGKTIFIKIWASWCKDCVEDLPNIETLKNGHKDVVQISLSLDKTLQSWKYGIKKFNVDGENYWINKGWKGSDFCKDIDLNWIPRYMVVDPKGNIVLYRAIKANDVAITDILSKINR